MKVRWVEAYMGFSQHLHASLNHERVCELELTQILRQRRHIPQGTNWTLSNSEETQPNAENVPEISDYDTLLSPVMGRCNIVDKEIRLPSAEKSYQKLLLFSASLIVPQAFYLGSIMSDC